MTPEETRIAIAEHLGFTIDCRHWALSEKPFLGAWETAKGKWYGRIPDYPNDLNACREMEAHLKEHGLWAQYVAELRKIICRDLGVHDHVDSPEVHVLFGMINAKALQKNEAFLRRVGKWREEQSA